MQHTRASTRARLLYTSSAFNATKAQKETFEKAQLELAKADAEAQAKFADDTERERKRLENLDFTNIEDKQRREKVSVLIKHVHGFSDQLEIISQGLEDNTMMKKMFGTKMMNKATMLAVEKGFGGILDATTELVHCLRVDESIEDEMEQEI